MWSSLLALSLSTFELSGTVLDESGFGLRGATLTLVHHEIKHNIEVVRDYGDVPPISVYPSRLNQVILNLLNNARQAIPGKGRITLRTRVEDVLFNRRGDATERLAGAGEVTTARSGRQPARETEASAPEDDPACRAYGTPLTAES